MEKGTFQQEFVAGNVGGIVGICFVYPLDLLKTRMQLTGNNKNMKSIFREMCDTNGFRSLYRGLLAPASGFGLTFAISFAGGNACLQFKHSVLSPLYFCTDVNNCIYLVYSSSSFCIILCLFFQAMDKVVACFLTTLENLSMN